MQTRNQRKRTWILQLFVLQLSLMQRLWVTLTPLLVPLSHTLMLQSTTQLTSITVAKGTKFTIKIDDTTYSFVVNETQNVTPVNGV